MELLLLSNSTNYGEEMFSHAASAFVEVVGERSVTFVPFALADWDDYADRADRRVRGASASRSSRPTGPPHPTGPSSRPTW